MSHTVQSFCPLIRCLVQELAVRMSSIHKDKFIYVNANGLCIKLQQSQQSAFFIFSLHHLFEAAAGILRQCYRDFQSEKFT